MYGWAIVFVIVAGVAGYLSFPHVTEPAVASVAKYVFFVFLALFIICAVTYAVRSRRK